MFVVLNQSSLCTTHRSYVGLILIINFTKIPYSTKISSSERTGHQDKKHPGEKLNGGSISFQNQQIKSNE